MLKKKLQAYQAHGRPTLQNKNLNDKWNKTVLGLQNLAFLNTKTVHETSHFKVIHLYRFVLLNYQLHVTLGT